MIPPVTLPPAFHAPQAPGNVAADTPAQSWFDAATVLGVLETIARFLKG